MAMAMAIAMAMAMARNVLLLLTAVALISAVVLGTRTVEETAEEMINALSHSNFEDWSAAFISTNDPVLGKTLPATLFIPLSTNVHGSDPRMLAAYHIVPEHLGFSDLLGKKDKTVLPTLLQGFNILLSNSSRGLTLNGVEIVEPDVFVDSVMAVHRIASPLDSGKYGGGMVSANWKIWAITLTAVCIMLSDVGFCIRGRNSIVGEGQLQNARRPRRSPRSLEICRT